MLVSDAQQDLSRAYVGGGPGVVVSSAVWLAATYAQHLSGISTGFVTLFVGGMFIFPIAKLVSRIIFRRQSESSSNPFGLVILESTIAMIGGLIAAWLFLATKPSLVFPVAAIAVGTHYFVFKSAYGDRLFWILASLVTSIGFADIFNAQVRGSTALLVAVTELAIGVVLTARALRSQNAKVETIS